MRLRTSALRKLIKEELAKGIPDFAFGEIAQELVNSAADDFVKVLIRHINTTANDPSIRNKRYRDAATVGEMLKRDIEFKTTIEDKLKDKLLVFLDKSR